MKMLLGQLVIEMKLFLRDRPSVFWTYFFPLFLILMFGLVFNSPDRIRFTVGVADADNTPASETLLAELSKQPMLMLEPGRRDSLEAAIARGELGVMIAIPDGYGAALRGDSALVVVRYHPDEIAAWQVVASVLGEVVNTVSWAALGRERPIAIEAASVRGARQEPGFMDFLVPGLIGFSLMSTCLFSIGVVVVSYREKGKLRRLAVTPLPKAIFIAGQILNRYLIVLLQAVLILVIALSFFKVTLVGSAIHLFAVLTVGMMAFIAIGYAVASVSATTETASGIANVLFLPMTFLSGVYFSVDGLPGFLQPLVEILPLTHLVRAIRAVFNEGLTVLDVWPQLAILAGWFVACFLFSVRCFKWE